MELNNEWNAHTNWTRSANIYILIFQILAYVLIALLVWLSFFSLSHSLFHSFIASSRLFFEKFVYQLIEGNCRGGVYQSHTCRCMHIHNNPFPFGFTEIHRKIKWIKWWNCRSFLEFVTCTHRSLNEKWKIIFQPTFTFLGEVSFVSAQHIDRAEKRKFIHV